MRTLLTMAVAATIAAPVFIAPTYASAQMYSRYGNGDVCNWERDRQKKKGTVAGAVIGGVLGAAVAGDGNKAEGALLGGTVGAFAGRQAAEGSFRCSNYPRRYRAANRQNCRWVQEYRGGRWQGFEVCRYRDGVWRPSGRY
ncbi:MAG: glycine zipper 2TM domain-containing protein [Caulobacter sp.]|jgi:outer membrane lipoprotein SlyB